MAAPETAKSLSSDAADELFPNHDDLAELKQTNKSERLQPKRPAVLSIVFACCSESPGAGIWRIANRPFINHLQRSALTRRDIGTLDRMNVGTLLLRGPLEKATTVVLDATSVAFRSVYILPIRDRFSGKLP